MDSQTPKETQIEARRFRTYSLYLEGLSQQEIADQLGVDRRTVFRDLKSFKNQLHENNDTNTIVNDIYSTIKTRSELIQARAESCKKDSDSARLWKVVADYDKLAANRFQINQNSDTYTKQIETMKQQLMAMVDYITIKVGPENLDDFIDFWKQRSTLENWS